MNNRNQYIMKHFFSKIRESSGLTLIEILVATLILALMTGGIYMVFSAGQAAWFNTDIQIQLQQDLRQILQRVSAELRQSHEDPVAANDHAFISDGAGVGGSDILKFSVPIICKAGTSLIDPTTGEIGYWGAPLQWGCTSLTCMDQDQDCAFLEYKYIRYSIDANKNFNRDILDQNNVLKRTDLIAKDITDFQVTSQLVGQVVKAGKTINIYMYTLSVTTQKKTVTNRTITVPASLNVYLRN
jgi:hypothetical protein